MTINGPLKCFIMYKDKILINSKLYIFKDSWLQEINSIEDKGVTSAVLLDNDVIVFGFQSFIKIKIYKITD